MNVKAKISGDMKRIFLAILIITAMVSCSKDCVVSTAPRQAITFGNVFIENSTRTAEKFYTIESLDKFFVYGKVSNTVNTVNLYKGAMVEKTDDEWNCDVTQYWVPECYYDFVAVSDVTATNPVNQNADNGAVVVLTDVNNGLPEEIKYDASSQKDLLYAKITSPISTSSDGIPITGVDEKGNVLFTFNHLLSKVMFTFTNGFTEASGVTLKVVDIKITDAAKIATYSCLNNQWANESAHFSGEDGDFLSFGDTGDIAPFKTGANSVACVLIPQTGKSYTITFTINHNKGDKPTNKTITTQKITLLPGHSYNLTTELNAGNVEGVVPITFNINKHNWENGDSDEVGPLYPEE